MRCHVNVRDEGPRDQRVILLLHGFLGSMRWFDRLVPHLRDSYRVIRVDLLGHGQSASPSGQYSPESQAAAISGALASSGLSGSMPITVVGHSFGADIAIAMAELRRLRVAGIAVIGEGPDYTTFTGNATANLLRNPLIGRPVFRALPSFLIRRSVELFFGPRFDVASAFDDAGQVVKDVRAVSYDFFLGSQEEKERYVAEQPLDARLAALGLPSLVVFGAEDRVFRVADSAERYRRVRGASVRVIDGAGHSPMLEAPDLVAGHIKSFGGRVRPADLPSALLNGEIAPLSRAPGDGDFAVPPIAETPR